MKEVVVNAWCDDPDKVHEARVQAVIEETVTILGRNYLLDLCADCQVRISEALSRWADAGALVKESASPKRRARKGLITDGTPASYRTCPECGHTANTRDSLGQHLNSQHRSGLSRHEWEYNPRAPGAREAREAQIASEVAALEASSTS